VKELFWHQDSAVPPSVCDSIIDAHVDGLRDAQIYSRSEGKPVDNVDKRRSRVNFDVVPETRQLCDYYTMEANRKAFGVNLGGYADYQFTAYDSANQGFYGWHMDSMGSRAFTRKLTFILLLSDPADYAGGGLQIGFEAPVVKPKKGTVIVFPSPVLHQVLPVTDGVRFSLVSWAEGPQWR